MKQIIIAIGREFGSGGHLVAKKLAEHYNIPLYSKELLDEVAKDGRYSKEVLERFDEKPMNFAFIPVPAGGTTISLEQDIAIRQFNFIRKKANEEKESFEKHMCAFRRILHGVFDGSRRCVFCYGVCSRGADSGRK